MEQPQQQQQQEMDIATEAFANVDRADAHARKTEQDPAEFEETGSGVAQQQESGIATEVFGAAVEADTHAGEAQREPAEVTPAELHTGHRHVVTAEATRSEEETGRAEEVLDVGSGVAESAEVVLGIEGKEVEAEEHQAMEGPAVKGELSDENEQGDNEDSPDCVDSWLAQKVDVYEILGEVSSELASPMAEGFGEGRVEMAEEGVAVDAVLPEGVCPWEEAAGWLAEEDIGMSDELLADKMRALVQEVEQVARDFAHEVDAFYSEPVEGDAEDVLHASQEAAAIVALEDVYADEADAIEAEDLGTSAAAKTLAEAFSQGLAEESEQEVQGALEDAEVAQTDYFEEFDLELFDAENLACLEEEEQQHEQDVYEDLDAVYADPESGHEQLLQMQTTDIEEALQSGEAICQFQEEHEQQGQLATTEELQPVETTEQAVQVADIASQIHSPGTGEAQEQHHVSHEKLSEDLVVGTLGQVDQQKASEEADEEQGEQQQQPQGQSEQQLPSQIAVDTAAAVERSGEETETTDRSNAVGEDRSNCSTVGLVGGDDGEVVEPCSKRLRCSQALSPCGKRPRAFASEDEVGQASPTEAIQELALEIDVPPCKRHCDGGLQSANVTDVGPEGYKASTVGGA